MLQAQYDTGQMRPGFEDGTYIPAWYKDHVNKEVQVLDNGVPMGFTISQVLPERRWAIQEDGSLLEQHIFEKQFIQWISLHHAGDNLADPSKEYIPSAAKFVNRRLDFNGKGVEILFDENKPAEEEIKPIYTQQGDLSTEASKKLAKLQVLQEMQEEGNLTSEEYAAKTALLLKEEEVHEFATQDPVETQEQVKEEIQVVLEEDPSAVNLSTIPIDKEAAACGKLVKRGYVKQHAAHCKNVECSKE